MLSMIYNGIWVVSEANKTLTYLYKLTLCSVRTNIRIYSNIFLQILIFVFDLWQFSKPNIIRTFKYFCMNISKYWSLKITWNTWIKEFYFPFLTWRYILTPLLITMIISCWSVNPLKTGHLCKAERKIFHLCITNYLKIFKYSNIFRIICNVKMKNFPK